MCNKINKTGTLEFQLGNLFYVIANADGQITKEEFLKLRTLIDQKWESYDLINNQKIIEQFMTAGIENFSVESCFTQFIEFVFDNKELFSNSIIDSILKTTNAIAYSYAKLNKSELHYLARLNLEFKKFGYLRTK